MTNQYNDPVNYELTNQDLLNPDYSAFLNELTDVPSSAALKPFSIDKAGIKEQQAYLNVRSLFNSESYVPMLVNITMQVELSGHRGIHMSRLEEALFALIDKNHESLDSFTKELAEKIIDLQKAEKSFVKAVGTYMHKRKTVRSSKLSHDRITMIASADCAKGKGTKLQIGLSAFNVTGCPCTETFTKFAVAPQLKKAGFNLEQINSILNITNSGTHTQRGQATILLDKASSKVTYEKLFTVLDNSCHLVYELLKRPDEHELVVRVLKNPQFTEDVVRDMVDQVIEIIGNELKCKSKIFASSQLYDSIHIHDVYTEIDKSYGEILNERSSSTSS